MPLKLKLDILKIPHDVHLDYLTLSNTAKKKNSKLNKERF